MNNQHNWILPDVTLIMTIILQPFLSTGSVSSEQIGPVDCSSLFRGKRPDSHKWCVECDICLRKGPVGVTRPPRISRSSLRLTRSGRTSLPIIVLDHSRPQNIRDLYLRYNVYSPLCSKSQIPDDTRAPELFIRNSTRITSPVRGFM